MRLALIRMGPLSFYCSQSNKAWLAELSCNLRHGGILTQDAYRLGFVTLLNRTGTQETAELLTDHQVCFCT